MKWVIKEGCGLPVKSWCDYVEPGALEQAKNLSNLPFAHSHIALMPDCHQGYGMPIGGVLAADCVIVPNAVGVDIGCGMCAVKTDIKADDVDTDTLKKILSEVRDRIPVGFNHQDNPIEHEVFNEPADHVQPVREELESATKQLGTLGGGNHFIELQKSEEGMLWLMIHSGSRNFGLKIANFFHKKALELCNRWFSDLPDKDLAFLPTGERDAGLYIDGMNYALAFAAANRGVMMDTLKDIVNDITTCGFDGAINIHHNYAVLENHFGKNVWVHRKGATSAKKGQLGIIPGSQGTASYIVEGKGCRDSFESCSHGAGRKMGRKAAQRELDLVAEQRRLDDQGILHSIRGKKDLDEAAGAYKDIDEVMESQTDLVKIVEKLTPLAVVKG